MRRIHGTDVYGIDLGPKSECAHYNSDLDIIAIRTPCCDLFYACAECHDALADHTLVPWPKVRFDEQAVMCGACGAVLTVAEYLACQHQCPCCDANFNPGCAKHAHRYFESDLS